MSDQSMEKNGNQDLEPIRHDWSMGEIRSLFAEKFFDLVYRAQSVHREHHAPNEVQTSTLLSIKTGACPEDCKYCSQSGHYDTSLTKEKLLEVDAVVQEAKAAKNAGASRFCMGAAWRAPREKDMPVVLEMVRQVKSLGLETCVTLGMLDDDQAKALADAGLDYYNHNLDTSPEHYGNIITTRSYQQRLDTLAHVRDNGIHVCSGGILGLGESREDRVSLLQQLANLPAHPDSVPINQLVPIEGTPMADTPPIDPFEFVRTIAVARIMMPKSVVRLSAGRETMDEALQALCFMAGANSIFYGDRLLTTDNPQADADRRLFERLDITMSACKPSSADELPVATNQEAVEQTKSAPLYYDAAAV